jgi:hypothetical protein
MTPGTPNLVIKQIQNRAHKSFYKEEIRERDKTISWPDIEWSRPSWAPTRPSFRLKTDFGPPAHIGPKSAPCYDGFPIPDGPIHLQQPKSAYLGSNRVRVHLGLACQTQLGRFHHGGSPRCPLPGSTPLQVHPHRAKTASPGPVRVHPSRTNFIAAGSRTFHPWPTLARSGLPPPPLRLHPGPSSDIAPGPTTDFVRLWSWPTTNFTRPTSAPLRLHRPGSPPRVLPRPASALP